MVVSAAVVASGGLFSFLVAVYFACGGRFLIWGRRAPPGVGREGYGAAGKGRELYPGPYPYAVSFGHDRGSSRLLMTGV